MNSIDKAGLGKERSFGRTPIEKAASDMIKDGKKLANEVYEEGRRRVDKAEKNVKEYSDDLLTKVKKNPLASVLIAAGLGFILSTLLRK